MGWSVTPEFLEERFKRSDGTAEQFRVNDTVTDPRICGATASTSTADNAANVNACVGSMSLAQKRQAYRLFLDLGIHRIAIKDDPASTTSRSRERAPALMEARAAERYRFPPGRTRNNRAAFRHPVA